MDFSKMSKEQLMKLYQDETAARQGGQAQPTQPGQPDIAALLQKAQPTGGQSIANAMSVLGGGKAIYGNESNDLSKLYEQEAIKKQFENDPNSLDYQTKQANLGLIAEKTKLAKAGYIQDENGNITKAPSASAAQPVGDTPQNTFTGNESGEDVLARLGPNDRKTVQGLLDYNIDPIHHFSGMNGAKARNYYFQLAQAVNPNLSEQTYPLQAKTKLDYGPAGKSGKNITSYGTAIKHLGTLQNEQAGTPSSSFRPLEQGQRFMAKTFNATSPENLAMTGEDAALTAVAGELSNIFKQSGGTDPEIQKWFDGYDRNAPHEAKAKFIQTGIDLMNGRMDALKSTYESTMGQPYQGYDPQQNSTNQVQQSVMTPQQQAARERIRQKHGI